MLLNTNFLIVTEKHNKTQSMTTLQLITCAIKEL